MKIFYSWNILCYLQALVLIIIFKKMPVLQNFTLCSAFVPKMLPQQEVVSGGHVGLVWVGVAGFWPPWTLGTHGGKEGRVLEPAECCWQLECWPCLGGGEAGITRARPADSLGQGSAGIPAAAEWLSTCGRDSFGPPAGSKGWWMWSPSSPLQGDSAPARCLCD